ncbi:rab11 family-interacting protein 4 isoform X8 [Schistocerca gregaria]|uniref:rab11 family-interacting protein 4 isoform X8 n=1 Tax=Schistocerca gregaria TaxID=7010 RepID=UPI00211DC409|nr:rab11 family-interacting protein 4 isoform X8 [Schistocerca gregaria]XP_049862955.1 rab11 family-interacting protein 4 isoform X8 [Schistocerca gregaria]XP_049862956.1 rab11 family-interacting protein 4 isoform X8 [Schistocerca gregaria]
MSASASESEEQGEQELALDLWQGQFEFVGEAYGQAPGYDDDEDEGVDDAPPLPPFQPPPLNGVRKSAAHAWCQDLSHQVSPRSPSPPSVSSASPPPPPPRLSLSAPRQCFTCRTTTCDTAQKHVVNGTLMRERCRSLLHKSPVDLSPEAQQLPEVQMLQQQVNVLADNQTNTDDRYTRAKQDSAALQARVLMLEEQVREAELRAEERLQEEQRRHRELMVRVEREKQLQVENCTIRLQTLELEAASLREEVTRLRAQTDRLRNEKQDMEEQLAEAQCAMSALREDAERLQEAERRLREEATRESHANAQVVEELSRELEVLRQEQLERSEMGDTSRSLSHSQQEEELAQQLCELQAELSVLRQQNKSLQESNEELQAQMLTRSLEEGRTLLTNGAGAGNSLAAELEAMSQDELNADASDNLSLEQMRTALKEQQEVNAQLRTYIDGILLNIVENYPQLLEVKTH